MSMHAESADGTATHAARAGVIYLASQSPRRRQLLEQIGVAHELLLPAAEEDAEALECARDGEAPADYVRRVTQLKLEAAIARLRSRDLPPRLILCADTTVALGAHIIGKPQDADDARASLQRLSGRWHHVLTAVALWDGSQVHTALNKSQVCFAPLPPDVIAAYVASGEPFGKAGAYAIQSSIAGWISQVSGSYSAIMGLPLYETVQLLRAAGYTSPPCTTS